MKFCTDCVYYKDLFGLCVSPENGLSPVDGEPNVKLAIERRSPSSIYDSDFNKNKCGLDAIHFKPKEATRKTWFQRIFNKEK